MKQRIDGVTPPYEPETDRALRRWMPPGVTREPLMLFKVLERHRTSPHACGHWARVSSSTAG